MTKNQLSRYVLTDELYKLLKDQIISHTMSAGDKINIDKLTRELGVSNIPIREALFRLASEGFTEISEKYHFSSVHYFSRLFHRQTGQTPRDFRLR